MGGIFVGRFAHTRQVERRNSSTCSYWKYTISNNKGRTCTGRGRERKRIKHHLNSHYHHSPQQHNQTPVKLRGQQPFPSAGSGGPSPGPETPLPLLPAAPRQAGEHLRAEPLYLHRTTSPIPAPTSQPHRPSPPFPSSGRASTRRGAKGSHGVGTEVDEDGEETLRGDGDDRDSDREARDSLKWPAGERWKPLL